MIKSSQEYQSALCGLMGSPQAYQAANILTVEGENILSDRAPWKRLAEHQEFYTKPFHRANQRKISSLFQGNKHVSERLSYCAFPETQGGSGVQFCRVRTCPICQWRRTMMWQARSFKKLPLAVEKYPTARYGLLTLTVKNCQVSELRNALGALKLGYKKLRAKSEFKKAILGSVWATEVTRRFDGSAHQHMHVLLMCKASAVTGRNYISKEYWSSMWKDSMLLDYEPAVHCKWFPKKSALESIHQIVGTLGYITKESSITTDREWFLEMAKQVHRVKAIGCTGVLKEFLSEPIKISEFSLDDRSNLSTLQYSELNPNRILDR